MRKIGVDGVITHLEQWQLKHEELSSYKKTDECEFGFKIDSNSEVFQEGTKYNEKSIFYDTWLLRRGKHFSKDVIQWFF